MKKPIAMVCVISWAGFWTLGYLALSASSADTLQFMVAGLLAALGFLSGSLAYMKLAKGGF